LHRLSDKSQLKYGLDLHFDFHISLKWLNFAKNNYMTDYKLVDAGLWRDYELIDSGNFEKLERFGRFVICRPEPQAVWQRKLSPEEWKRADARFVLDVQNSNGEKGRWTRSRNMPEQWNIGYAHDGMNLSFVLRFNTFKHIGVFPEQADNWNFIYDNVKRIMSPDCNVLNLFAYTGGASIAARAAGAKVYHVDSVRQVVNWASENQSASGLSDIHWVVEDAMKFVKREIRRGNKYSGIIMDPPAFGRGPAGEKWILEDSIDEIVSLSAQLLKEKDAFFILNLYSMGLSALISDNIVQSHFGNVDTQCGEMFFTDRAGRRLPLGTFVRFSR
jgi:23S rRNA (cytosine1962-C5)-methyltransferase